MSEQNEIRPLEDQRPLGGMVVVGVGFRDDGAPEVFGPRGSTIAENELLALWVEALRSTGNDTWRYYPPGEAA